MADTTAWSHTFDFRTSPSGWFLTGDGQDGGGSWVSGTGFVSSRAGNNYDHVRIAYLFALPALVNTIIVNISYSSPATGAGNDVIYSYDGVTGITLAQVLGNTSPNPFSFTSNPPTSLPGILVDILASNPSDGRTATITSITIAGIGPDPALKHKGPKDCPLCDAAAGAEEGGG